MFIHLDPTATVSVWQPKTSERGVTLADDEMVSGFKIFCPYHLLVRSNIALPQFSRQNFCWYSGDPKSDHLKTRNIRKPDIFEVCLSNEKNG